MPVVIASEGAFQWLGLLPILQGDNAEYLPFAHSMLAVVIILAFAWLARMGLMSGTKDRESLIPDADLKPKNFFEMYTEALLNMCRGVLGKDAEAFFPLIAGIFLYIFVCNMLGVFPGLLPPTDQLNTNIPIAIVIFITYNVVGIMRNGPVEYAKHFMGPIIWLAPLMLVIEIISHLSRPLSLSVRLYGNIMGDHQVLDIFMNVLPAELSAVLGFGIPVIFLGLGIFVSFIQALVFSLLSVSYIGLAVAHDH
jgi:F-type H+-transporting ATPase subunit a